jgi:nucleotide-binding universal stress UspA family protein
MRSLSKILLPVDFSERSVGAARYTRLLASQSQCESILLHVVPPVPFQLGPVEMVGATAGELYRSQRESLQRELNDLRDAELAGIKVRTLLLDGDPASRIVEFAHREQVDLIVMPTHGYGPFRRFILGSNTAKVLHDADCPVWTGVHIAEAPSQPIELRHILCGVDLGAQSVKALAWAEWFRRLFGARLTLMHVTATGPEPADDSQEAWRASLRWAAEKELRRVLVAAASDAELLVEAGEPASAICSAVARLKAGLVVIGRGSAAGVFGRLRTNSYAIIRQSPSPVVSV